MTDTCVEVTIKIIALSTHVKTFQVVGFSDLKYFDYNTAFLLPNSYNLTEECKGSVWLSFVIMDQNYSVINNFLLKVAVE